MNKKTTTILGIALGATLAAGFGLYTYFSNKNRSATGSTAGSGPVGPSSMGGFIGNSLIKSNSLYGLGQANNDLIGGGLYRAEHHA